jgi:hypothetical protein
MQFFTLSLVDTSLEMYRTSFGRQKIRGISVWGAYSLSDQHSGKSCFVFYYNAVISTMEFPPETYDVFEADQFESARA